MRMSMRLRGRPRGRCEVWWKMVEEDGLGIICGSRHLQNAKISIRKNGLLLGLQQIASRQAADIHGTKY